MDGSFSITWEDATTVVQSEEVITMENEIIPSQSQEFIGDETEETYVENVQDDDDLALNEVSVVEEEVVQDDSVEEVTLENQQADGGLMYLTEDNVLVMDSNEDTPYTQDQLMEVTEEVITDQWGECPEEMIIGSEEAVGAVDGQAIEDEDIPLPTDQDEYTAARPYPCDFCSRRFRKKANLMNHMVAHQTDRPHGCNLCGLRYLRKSDLMNHLKSHAYIPESEPIEDEDLSLEHQGFERRKKVKSLVEKKKKRIVKEEYENLFTTEPVSADEKYIGDMDATYLTTSSQEEIRYPVIDPKKPFVCQHCGVAFAREKALASHARVHGGDSPFECQKCGEMFWDISLMQEHSRTKHGEIEDIDDDEDEDYSDSEEAKYGTFYCPTCGLSFHRQDNLKRHQRIHIKEEFVHDETFGHICNVCGECFQEALDLLAHAEIHARGSEYRCMVCGEICMDEAALAGHVQSTHKNLPPHTCVLCGRTCKDNRTLMKHSWEHSKEKCFACTKCSKTFHNKARLKRHMISHRNKVVSCDVCGEDFPDGRSLMNHRHSHSSVSGRQFPCRECGKTFGSRSSQQIHIRIHTGERPYGCRFCWKAFADGGTLRKHERIHTGEKPYACAVCPRAFNQRVVLREHIRSHHSGPDPKYSHSMTPYCCAVCSDMFAASQDLILHLIHHCDMNTAMKRQPQIGPRKYKRRKLKPHELEMMTAQNEESYNSDQALLQNANNTTDSEEERERRRTRPKRSYTRKPSSSPKTSVCESMSDIYNAASTIEAVESITLPKSPTSKTKPKKGKNDASSVPSRPKMIHTQKTRVPVETGEDGRVRHRTRTLVTRTQPAEIKSVTGERIRPRTKNVSYHVLNPEKFPIATFPSAEQTNEAVESLLKEASEEIPTNGNIITEEIVEETPEVAGEQIVESEQVPIPVGIVEVRTRRNSARSTRNVIGPGSKVRLVKEGMIISKMKRSSESQLEPETIVPDMNPTAAVYIKEEHFNTSNDDTLETNVTEEEQPQEEPQPTNDQFQTEETVDQRTPNGNPNVINVKQEMMDPSALHELAELSMRHANHITDLFKCEMCDEVFTDRAQLLLHVPVHI